MDASDIDLDLDSNFEPQTRARSNTWPLRPQRELETYNSPVNGEEVTNGAESHGGSKDPLGLAVKKSGSRRNAWGNLSYADLITRAIQSSPEKRLTLSQIYDWMVQNVPYFKDKGDNTSSAGWKNSIRHNLSLHNRFMRIQNEGTGKSSWWVLNPDAKPGKTPRRRAGSMETKSFEKKRGRVRKKVESLRAALENGELPTNGSDDYLDSLSFGPFRTRAGSDISSCSRLSPINDPLDNLDNSAQWVSESTGNTSPTSYTGENSDLLDTLIDGMKLTNQDNLKMGELNTFLPNNPREFSGTSFMGVDHVSPGIDGQYANLKAPPPYPQQQKQQLNKVDFSRPEYSNLHIPCRSNQSVGQTPSFSHSDIFNKDFTEVVMNMKREASPAHNYDSLINIKQESLSPNYNDVIKNDSLSPGHLSVSGGLTVNTQKSINSPERAQQASPSTGGFNPHLSPQSQPLINGQMSLMNCQVSPQPNRHLGQQQTMSSSLHQQQQASILREALTRGSYNRSHPVTNTSMPTYTTIGNQLPIGTAHANNNGFTNVGMSHNNSDLSPHHRPPFMGGHLRIIDENFAENNYVNGLSSSTGMPLDIDVDVIQGLDYDMDQVIKQELTLEGNLDFNFDAGQNVVH